jgi:hypothetical protein
MHLIHSAKFALDGPAGARSATPATARRIHPQSSSLACPLATAKRKSSLADAFQAALAGPTNCRRERRLTADDLRLTQQQTVL